MTEFANTRAAGILWPVTCTPTQYGIGDLGPASRAVVDTIRDLGLKMKQELPFNPTGYGDSPFSSYSAFAGNPYYISPDMLFADKLLTSEDLERLIVLPGNSIDYSFQYGNKHAVLRSAYERFVDQGGQDELDAYLNREAGWLVEYALYSVIKGFENLKGCQEWDSKYRNLVSNPLRQSEFISRHEDKIGYYVFEQYVFEQQYLAYKNYCNAQGIHLVGDIPVYVAGDSADFYFRPDLFQLNAKGGLSGVAGVPPDLFSSTGQLWGNPLYDWQGNFDGLCDWWESRLSRALKFSDVIKIDHARGFIDYWRVDPDNCRLPDGTETAEHGAWITGPGKAFFDEMQRRLGTLPIILEDLGDINDETRKALDNLELPGMSVTQFGMMGNEVYFPESVNEAQIVYTQGTHDNATTIEYLASLSDEERNEVDERMAKWGAPLNGKEAPGMQAIRVGLGTPARIAIVHASDAMNLGKEGTLNRPGTRTGNWQAVFPEHYARALSPLADALQRSNRD